MNGDSESSPYSSTIARACSSAACESSRTTQCGRRSDRAASSKLTSAPARTTSIKVAHGSETVTVNQDQGRNAPKRMEVSGGTNHARRGSGEICSTAARLHEIPAIGSTAILNREPFRLGGLAAAEALQARGDGRDHRAHRDRRGRQPEPSRTKETTATGTPIHSAAARRDLTRPPIHPPPRSRALALPECPAESPPVRPRRAPDSRGVQRSLTAGAMIAFAAGGGARVTSTRRERASPAAPCRSRAHRRRWAVSSPRSSTSPQPTTPAAGAIPSSTFSTGFPANPQSYTQNAFVAQRARLARMSRQSSSPRRARERTTATASTSTGPRRGLAEGDQP